MIDTKLLKQKILDLAIRGKLVPQDPNDEPASVLLERIRAEKERLVAEGKIKRSKSTTDNRHYENVPFEIPDGWEWVRLGDLYNAISAKRVLQADWKHSGVPFYRAREIVKLSQNGCVDNDLFISEEHYQRLKTVYGIPLPSDIMLSAVGTIGKTYIVRKTDRFYYKDASVLCLQNVHGLCSEYMQLALNSAVVQEQMHDQSKGTTVDTITIEKVGGYLIPFPPLEEQRRIVKKLEQWFTLAEEIEANQQNIQEAVKQAKSKILSLAIRGRLVAQDSNDEPAIDLLKRINPEFVPCDTSHYGNVPLNWCACTFKDIFEITMGSSPSGNSLNREQSGIEFHQGKTCFTEKYVANSDIYTTLPTKTSKANSILLCVRAPVGIVNIAEREICIGRGLCALYPRQNIDLMFAFYAMQTYQSTFDDKGTGTTFKAIGGDTIRTELFLLPPYNEQIRIRKKLDEVFASLDTITAML